MRFAFIGCAACLWLSGCGDSVTASSGLSEPLRVSNGQFFSGEFPGPSGGPAIDSPNGIRNGLLQAGMTGKKISGVTDNGSYSVALKLEDIGSGYWVVPVGAADLTEVAKLGWSATCDFSRDIPAGSYTLQVAAADHQGQFGKQASAQLIVTDALPKGGVVASLTWGNDADVDLHIVSPSGKELDPKHPTTSTLDSDGVASVGGGTLDHDSNAGCIADGYREESVVWTAEPPEPGTYLVHADMFNACGRQSTTFKFTLTVDGELVQQATGRLLDTDADNGGLGSGLFVTEFTL